MDLIDYVGCQSPSLQNNTDHPHVPLEEASRLFLIVEESCPGDAYSLYYRGGMRGSPPNFVFALVYSPTDLVAVENRVVAGTEPDPSRTVASAYQYFGKMKVAQVRVLQDGDFHSLASLDPEPVAGTVTLLRSVLGTRDGSRPLG